MIFERVIGLGEHCMTKCEINTYFNPGEIYSKTKKGHSDIFDWMKINNYSKLSDVLIENFENFFEYDDLIVNVNDT